MLDFSEVLEIFDLEIAPQKTFQTQEKHQSSCSIVGEFLIKKAYEEIKHNLQINQIIANSNFSSLYYSI